MAKKVKVINEVTVSDTDIKCPGCGATIKLLQPVSFFDLFIWNVIIKI